MNSQLDLLVIAVILTLCGVAFVLTGGLL